MMDTQQNGIKSAEILAIGTEILMGQIVNTNAAFLARELRDLGIDSKYQTVVGDNEARIIEAINTSLKRSDLLLITGGLGPTEDDISMSTTVKALGLELEFHPESWERILGHFKKSGREVMPSNRRQAMLPAGSTVLPNDNGTAPGCFITASLEGKEVFVALLPGPPSENSLMFKRYLEPLLRDRSSRTIESRFIHLIGIGESQAEELIRDLVHDQSDPTIAPYASEGEVTIRVTTASKRDQASLAEAEQRLNQAIDAIQEKLGEYIYHIGEESLYEVTINLMKQRGLTLSVAESCTAGLLSAKLGDISGLSKVFMGGVVSYANAVKVDLLSVREETLASHGAVSHECAEEMALGVMKRCGSDYAIAITGIAGPDGGTEEKPVGTIYMAVAGPHGVISEHHVLNGNRRRIRENAALWSMNLLRRRILGQ